jgi:hypothetical protein
MNHDPYGAGMIRDINTELMRVHFDAAGALLWLVSAPFYALGWLAGFIVRCVLWILASLIAGYKQGRSA